MTHQQEEWRFLRNRAEQLYEEGDTRRALRLMRRINLQQEEAFAQALSLEERHADKVSIQMEPPSVMEM